VIRPGTVFGDRVNQVDLRFGKVIRIAGTSSTVSLDLYNAFNANPVLAQNNTFGAAWLRPTSVFPARFSKISWQFDF